MNSALAMPDHTAIEHPLKKSFLKWQCLTRQIMMRDHQGRPNDAITPAVIPAGKSDALGHIITILNKAPAHALLPEMKHLLRKTNDPAQIRQSALTFLSATYYQKAKEFSDLLTSTFLPGSDGAAIILAAGRCTLVFEAYSQVWRLECGVRQLSKPDPLFEATLTHNRLFNPVLPNDTMVLGFEPDWSKSSVS